jgi:carbonic anhydrase
MDHTRDDGAEIHAAGLPRRSFLRLVSGAAIGLAAAGPAAAAPTKAPPKPENVLTPDAALARLSDGNQRYVDGLSRKHDFKNEREPLTTGQNPFAAILSCADSRIAPEYAFDAARGDLFVCRVAGNLLNDDVLASLEYAISVLKTRLVMVLGHEACGAVAAAIESVQKGTTLPGHLPSLVRALTPAVKAVQGQKGNTLELATRQNVLLTVGAIRSAAPILDKAVKDGQVKVVGGLYHLGDGRVELVK